MSDEPEQLLFTKQDGERGDLQDVIYDGLDHDYSARVPALERLLDSGTPAHKLYACAMLAAWGVPSALRVMATWARAPERAPWANEPVTLERFGGADSAFELLADSIGIAQDARDRDATTDALRADVVRALLASFHRVYTGRKLYEVMDLDHALREKVRDEIGPAVERGLAAARTGTLGFDMPTQVASLIGTLAEIDDARAAKAAESLLADQPGLVRTHNEVAYALRHGTGPATLAVLDELVKSPHASVRQQASESLARRRPS